MIFADTGSHTDNGRLANGLETAKEFVETPGDEVEIVFDEAGTQWVSVFEDAVAETGVLKLDDHGGHPSIWSLVAGDYEIITV